MYEKNITYISTAFVSILFIIILIKQTLNVFDKLFVIVVLISHIFFYYSLYYNDNHIINIIHYTLFISLLLSIFVKNKYLLSICLSIIIFIQILWIICKECILNRISYIECGYGDLTSIMVLLLTIALSFKLGFIVKN